MNSKRKGFSLYLTFLVTTVIFILVSGSYEIGRISLDLSKSSAIDTILFHAADGGLEKGLAHLRQSFKGFSISYRSLLSSNQAVEVVVTAEKEGNKINLKSTATLFAGKSRISTRCLARKGIENSHGRTGCGHFLEASS
ncbi:MAG: hypothetical protein ACOYXC_21075 [Candidatus Rifleibacteriota bacterium]